MNDMMAVLAYINPGTGSLLWQFLLVGFAGVLVNFRTCSQWIRERLTRKTSPHPSQEPDGR
jgi:hypothetical protein